MRPPRVSPPSPLRNDSGERVTIRQPLPMPEGVPDSAVGGRGAGGARAAGRFRLRHKKPMASRTASGLGGSTSGGRGGVPTRNHAVADDAEAEDEPRAAKAAARRRVHRAVRRFRAGIERVLAADPSAGGTLRIALVVRPNGEVAKVRVLRSSLGSESIQRRLVKALRGLHLGRSRRAHTLRLSITL